MYDTEWARFFADRNLLQDINRDGYVYISSSSLNEYAQARNMVKLDSLEDRPRIFQENQLVIFPVINKKYIIFKDPQNKSYFTFSDDDLELPVNVYSSNVDLYRYDSFPGLNFTGEMQALDFAHISSLIAHITNENDLRLVIRGRSYSGAFDFFLHQHNHQVNVRSVQIEVDGGYENSNSIILVEAKIGSQRNFNIRQLYYPYLNWSHKSNKFIIPIFFFYSNNKYFFYKFHFEDEFGEIRLTEKTCFSLNESPQIEIDLRSMNNEIPVENEPRDIPLPQADDFDKVIDSVSLVSQGFQTKEDIAESFGFDVRQGDYYLNAAKYMGFIISNQNNLALTEIGQRLLNTRSVREKTLVTIKQFLKIPILRQSIQLFVDRGADINNLSINEISQIVLRNRQYESSTILRRSSTIRSWLKWISRNVIFNR